MIKYVNAKGKLLTEEEARKRKVSEIEHVYKARLVYDTDNPGCEPKLYEWEKTIVHVKGPSI